MKGDVLKFIKNFSYTISSNLISLIVSSLVVLVLPKLIGIKAYGYWQLYLFYTAYIGFLHFGWNDGIYLRYGGKKYETIDKKVFFSQFYMLAGVQIIIAILIIILSYLFTSDINKVFILKMTALCMIISNLRLMLLFILQSTNRIKEYSFITMIDKIVYVLIIILILLIGIRKYEIIILSDLIGKGVSLILAMIYCKDIVFRKVSDFYIDATETITNINVGVKLMFANIASMLIIGVIRFGIERSWDVETFGKISLTLSISKLMMIFINAIGIVIYPILRRTDREKLSSIYISIRDILMIVLLGVLIIYYPLKMILVAWLPEYKESLTYMALIFPMCVYEGKMALLINTYFKTLRLEKLMLKINLFAVTLSFITTIITTVIFKNLDIALLSIVVLLSIRCIIAEIYIGKIIHIGVEKDILLEVILTIVFIATGWFINSWSTLVIYLIIYMLYLCIKRNDIKKTIYNIRLLVISK